jgi:hypothetical protein
LEPEALLSSKALSFPPLERRKEKGFQRERKAKF